MAILAERARAVIALLSAASDLLTMAEGEGQNTTQLLRATAKAKRAIKDETGRQVKIYDANRT